jgi:hypothetical protein
LEKRQGILRIFELASVLEKIYRLTIKVVDSQRNKPIQDVNVKVFRVEKGPITPKQWAENLRNGTPFETLMISTTTSSNGSVTVEFPEGSYEVIVAGCSLNQVCELTQNLEILFIEPKKHWW